MICLSTETNAQQKECERKLGSFFRFLFNFNFLISIVPSCVLFFVHPMFCHIALGLGIILDLTLVSTSL
jgi:hypothetical protein